MWEDVGVGRRVLGGIRRQGLLWVLLVRLEVWLLLLLRLGWKMVMRLGSGVGSWGIR